MQNRSALVVLMIGSLVLELPALAQGVTVDRQPMSPQPPEPALPVNGPALFDIAGVTLGMAPAAVRRALTTASYGIDVERKTQDFAEQVRAKIASLGQQRHLPKETAPLELQATGPAGERLHVTFRQWPAGPRVSQIAYHGAAGRQTPDAFKAQLQSKFGLPSSRSADGGRWCAKSENCAALAFPRQPTLAANYYNLTATLNDGPAVEESHRALVEREVRKIMPLSDRGSF